MGPTLRRRLVDWVGRLASEGSVKGRESLDEDDESEEVICRDVERSVQLLRSRAFCFPKPRQALLTRKRTVALIKQSVVQITKHSQLSWKPCPVKAMIIKLVVELAMLAIAAQRLRMASLRISGLTHLCRGEARRG